MATQINVDPAKKDDHFYRYKMPEVATKVEGNGNGIKTVFPNIKDIAVRLNRPDDLIMRFISYEVAALAKYHEKDDKWTVMGQHSKDRVQEKIYDFITKFVLCKHCRNPETDMSVDNKKVHELVVPRVLQALRRCPHRSDGEIVQVREDIRTARHNSETSPDGRRRRRH